MLVVQKDHNKFGSFLLVLEYGQENRKGFLVTLEGSKGEGREGSKHHYRMQCCHPPFRVGKIEL